MDADKPGNESEQLARATADNFLLLVVFPLGRFD